MLRIRRFALVLTVAALVMPGRANAAASNGQTWLVVSDIHLDPFSRRKDPSLFGSDTNLRLLRSAIAEMKRDVPDPAVVLLPGDFLAHAFARVRGNAPGSVEIDSVATMRLIATAFGRAFPNARFAPALGNNDSPCGDYFSSIGSAYLAAVAQAWAPLVDRGGAAPGFSRAFAHAGHYTAALPLPGMRLVVLDDVPLSSLYRGNCGVRAGDAATAELDWLRTTLAATPPQTRNVVMMHVPPGFDVLTSERIGGIIAWRFLGSEANDALLNALEDPQHRVAFVVAGHAHRFDFRLETRVPILVFGSVSPIYHNNPAFYALHLDARGDVRDIDAFAFDEWTQAWQPARSFDRKWHVRGIDAAALAALHERLGRDEHLRRAWGAAASGWPSNRTIAWTDWGKSWRMSWCAQRSLRGGFLQCAGLTDRAMLYLVTVVLAAFAAGTLAVGAVLAATRRRRT